jgi:hypothetical protein
VRLELRSLVLGRHLVAIVVMPLNSFARLMLGTPVPISSLMRGFPTLCSLSSIYMGVIEELVSSMVS